MKTLVFFFILIITLCFQKQCEGQALNFNYPSTNKVTLSIKAKKRITHSDKVEIVMEWKNNSDSIATIMINDTLENHPMGVGASIYDFQGKSLIKYPSKHILSSRIYFPEELEKFEIQIEPGATYEHHVKLENIPIFNAPQLNKLRKLSKGQYKVSLTYYGLFSNVINVIID